MSIKVTTGHYEVLLITFTFLIYSKNNRQLSEEFVNPNDLAQAEANMRNLLDVGLGEIVTGRIVYD